MAVTSYMKTIGDLDLVQVAILPLFLFSGTFYNLSVYPAWLRVIVECLPLQHGIALLRGLNAGAVDWALAAHASYFAVMAVVGLVVTARRLDTLLLR
jgi:lipooligosaccharide transport system permease protein